MIYGVGLLLQSGYARTLYCIEKQFNFVQVSSKCFREWALNFLIFLGAVD